MEKPESFLQQAREQLILWVETAREELADGSENILPRIVRKLLLTDSLTAEFNHLEKDIKRREDYFIGNSIKGMLHYLQKN